MFKRYYTKGFVFKKSDVGEADRLYSVFTKDFGRVELFAKSARKIDSKLKSHLELGDFAFLEFVQGRKKILTDAKLLFRPKIVKKDLLKTAALFEICSFFDKLVRGQEPDRRIWKLLGWTIRKLDKQKITSEQSRLVFYYFAIILLKNLGYEPPSKIITKFKELKRALA